MKRLFYIENTDLTNLINFDSLPSNCFIAIELTDLQDQLDSSQFQELVIFSDSNNCENPEKLLKSLPSPLPDTIVFKPSDCLNEYVDFIQ